MLVLFESHAYGMSEDVKRILRSCAPSVDMQTMASIINAESSGYVYAVADAGLVSMPWSIRKYLVKTHYPESLNAAVTLAKDLIAQGHTVSLGPGQLNDRNLAQFRMSISDAFDVCKNLQASSQLLTQYYLEAVKKFGAGQLALIAALSKYNSGSYTRGLNDGYVKIVFSKAQKDLEFKYVPPKKRLWTKVASANERRFVMGVRPYKLEEASE